MLRTYALTRGTGTPLYEQLYRAIRQDILTGQLPGGTKLPSKRALAEHLSISKITVETAYAQLLAEGYLTARERSGYYVEQLAAVPPAAPQPAPSRAAPEPLPPTSRSAELFPFSVWARLMRSVILDEGAALLCPTPGAGLLSLRQAICEDLLRRRGMHVEPQQVYLGAGTEYFYHLLLEFFGRERVYALETLGHRKIARICAASGVRYVPIGMDDDGILPALLDGSGAEILHLSPSHHYPTGIVTPIARRQAILRWLTGRGDRYLIEDDYDSEFRFSGRPIPPMQTMDFAGRVIYMNTFSKTIAPALRISYMILPPRLLDAWEEKMGFYSCTVPAFEQLTLTRFLSGGYFERHLSRMRHYYRAQLSALLAVLAEEPYRRVCTVLRADAGLHFVLQFHTPRSDDDLQDLLRTAGLHTPPLSSFYIRRPDPASRGRVVVNYADLPPEQFRAALDAILPAL